MNHEITSTEHVLKLLDEGHLVAIPTESSFALAGRVDRPDALVELCRYKPDRNSPVGLMMGGRVDLSDYVVNVTAAQKNLMQVHWPGPVSIIFDAIADLSEVITANTGSVSIRVPAEPWLADMLNQVGVPLTATSANRSGEPPICDFDTLAVQFPELYRYTGIPRTPGGPPSTLVDGRGLEPVVLREGPVQIHVG